MLTTFGCPTNLLAQQPGYEFLSSGTHSPKKVCSDEGEKPKLTTERPFFIFFERKTFSSISQIKISEIVPEHCGDLYSGRARDGYGDGACVWDMGASSLLPLPPVYFITAFVTIHTFLSDKKGDAQRFHTQKRLQQNKVFRKTFKRKYSTVQYNSL